MGRDVGHVKGDSLRPKTVVSAADSCWYVRMHSGMGCKGIYCGDSLGTYKGIPCSPTRLCELQTTVGLCTCTLGWAVSESIVGIVYECVRGFPVAQHGCVSRRLTVGLCACTLGWGSAVKNGYSPWWSADTRIFG